jgi:hypothetical protein
MDIIFTFPFKNPKYQTISELYKTCVYLQSQGLSISTEYKKKNELIERVVPFYDKYGNKNLPSRIEFQLLNQSYSINTQHSFKKIHKLSEINNIDKYILTDYRGKLSYIVEYNKINETYIIFSNFKTLKNKQVQLPYIHPTLNKIRYTIGYLELKHIYMNLILMDDLIVDIVKYIVLQYKSINSLPSVNYTIL